MADFATLKKKNRLGTPPNETEIRNNLEAPETHYNHEASNLDGRSLRKTGRTHQFGTRVKIDFYKKIKKIAFDEEITIAELLERAVDLYDKNKER